MAKLCRMWQNPCQNCVSADFFMHSQSKIDQKSFVKFLSVTSNKLE